MPGRRLRVVGYMLWLSGGQHGSGCWQHASAMWMARRAVAGGPGFVVDGGQALNWIWCSWSAMVGSPSGRSFDVVGGGGRAKALCLWRRRWCHLRVSRSYWGAALTFPPPSDTQGENLRRPRAGAATAALGVVTLLRASLLSGGASLV
jgi:hypothetical protein